MLKVFSRVSAWWKLRRIPRPGKEFGHQVRSAREHMGLSREETAAMLHVPIEQLECVEAGLFDLPPYRNGEE